MSATGQRVVFQQWQRQIYTPKKSSFMKLTHDSDFEDLVDLGGAVLS